MRYTTGWFIILHAFGVLAVYDRGESSEEPLLTGRSNEPQKHSGPPVGAIVGGAVGGVLGVFLLGYGVYYYRRHYLNKQPTNEAEKGCHIPPVLSPEPGFRFARPRVDYAYPRPRIEEMDRERRVPAPYRSRWEEEEEQKKRSSSPSSPYGHRSKEKEDEIYEEEEGEEEYYEEEEGGGGESSSEYGEYEEGEGEYEGEGEDQYFPEEEEGVEPHNPDDEDGPHRIPGVCASPAAIDTPLPPPRIEEPPAVHHNHNNREVHPTPEVQIRTPSLSLSPVPTPLATPKITITSMDDMLHEPPKAIALPIPVDAPKPQKISMEELMKEPHPPAPAPVVIAPAPPAPTKKKGKKQAGGMAGFGF